MPRYAAGSNRNVRGNNLGDLGAKQTGLVITGAGNTTPFDTTDDRMLVGSLTVTAASGTTPNLTVNVQTSYDGGSTWVTLGSFTAKTGVTAVETKAFTGLGDQTRFQWAAPTGTTPSFTVTLDGYTK